MTHSTTQARALLEQAQAIAQAHPWKEERQDLAGAMLLHYFHSVKNGEEITLADCYKKARSEIRRLFGRQAAMEADNQGRPVVVEGKRQQQREATEAIAENLGVSTRTARRMKNQMQKKATGQGDFFGGVVA